MGVNINSFNPKAMSPSEQTHHSGPALASSSDTGAGLKRLVLASASPRRRELVKAFDQPVELRAPLGQEAPHRSGEPPEAYVLRLALAKAEEVAAQTPGSVVLGAAGHFENDVKRAGDNQARVGIP